MFELSKTKVCIIILISEYINNKKILLGTFSFGSYAKFKSQTITEFIEKAVEHSRSGRLVLTTVIIGVEYKSNTF